MAHPEKAVGELWGYREKPYNAKCPIVPVEILQLLDQWVARNGLRVRWDDVEGWLRDEEHYDHLARVSQVASDDTAFQAAERVYWLEELEGVGLELAARYGAILEIDDVSAFAAQFGLDVPVLPDEPGITLEAVSFFTGDYDQRGRLPGVRSSNLATASAMPSRM